MIKPITRFLNARVDTDGGIPFGAIVVVEGKKIPWYVPAISEMKFDIDTGALIRIETPTRIYVQVKADDN